jgi:hypothetical protein
VVRELGPRSVACSARSEAQPGRIPRAPAALCQRGAAGCGCFPDLSARAADLLLSTTLHACMVSAIALPGAAPARPVEEVMKRKPAMPSMREIGKWIAAMKDSPKKTARAEDYRHLQEVRKLHKRVVGEIRKPKRKARK